MEFKHYSPSNNNVAANAGYQGIDYSVSPQKQLDTQYPGIDNLQNATINDSYIYLSTSDAQHAKIINGEPLSKDDHTALSGYFTNEATAQSHLNADGTFDAYGFHRDLCVKPSTHGTLSGEPEDKRHLDRFYIDRDRLQEIYGTRDFNAAIGKCNENNQYGSDGGDQGYNACLNEIYNNGCLKYAGTNDASPESITKCQSEYDAMGNYANEKCKAIISGKSADEIQNIGYPLDARCHGQTQFNVDAHTNSDQKYQGYSPQYNEDIANATKPSDRLYTSESFGQSNKSSQASSSNTSFNQSNAGPSPSEITQPQKPEATNAQHSSGANLQDLPPIQPPHSAEQSASSAGPDKIPAANTEAVPDAANKAAATTSDTTENALNATKSKTGGIT